MDKKIYFSAAAVLIITVMALIAYNNIEIYQRKKHISPSQETLNNLYYAMEKWLNETGHPVRYKKESSAAEIYAIPEKTAIVFAKTCNWEEAQEFLIPWIEKGNSLTICLNYSNSGEIDDELFDFLYSFGINAEVTSGSVENRDETLPYFDENINFKVDENKDIFTISDNNMNVKLAEVSLGEGKLTVIGNPIFMFNNNLKREENARLAWNLSGARAAGGSAGVLFVLNNSRYVSKSLFGKLMEKGNILPMIVSGLLVILLGFWKIIPIFGFVYDEKQKNSRPIRERFAAEISFLKKYKALNYYLEIYRRERIITGELQIPQEYSYRKLINNLRSVYNGTRQIKH